MSVSASRLNMGLRVRRAFRHSFGLLPRFRLSDFPEPPQRTIRCQPFAEGLRLDGYRLPVARFRAGLFDPERDPEGPVPSASACRGRTFLAEVRRGRGRSPDRPVTGPPHTDPHGMNPVPCRRQVDGVPVTCEAQRVR